VRYIFDSYAEGTGYNSIINFLNGMGHRSKTFVTKSGKVREGKPFSKTMFHNMLKNPKYHGLYIYNRKKEYNIARQRRSTIKPESEWIVVEDGIPAIIDKETFDKVQLKLKENSRRGGKYRAKEVYLLSGLIHCAECGAALSGNSRLNGAKSSRYVSYRCSGNSSKLTCSNKELRREPLEAFVLDQLFKRLFSENSIAKLPAVKNFIQSYVEKVIVYTDKVEVIFKISVPDEQDQLVPITSSICKDDLQMDVS